MNLTQTQQDAINCIDRNLQIVACAGSGKTRVVTERILHILDTRDDVGPESVVAFTFTEKAAAELKDRVARGYQNRFGSLEGLAGMYVGTIHGFCLDLLQQNLPQYLKYDVLDEIGQRLFIDRNSSKSGLTPLGLRRWIQSKLYQTILGVVREDDVDLSTLPSQARASFDAYQWLLEQHSYLDFSEILVRAVRELETNDDLRDLVANRIRFVTVDEYQDINPLQERLIRTLAELGANVCVVGDDDQNIFQWRGSDVSHILSFAYSYDDVETINLSTNFRSTDRIVTAGRRVAEQNIRRLEKEMDSGSHHSFEMGDLLALPFESRQAEAEWIADKILRMRGTPYVDEPGSEPRGISWSDFAVLLRSVKGSAGPIIDAFRSRDIPYVISGMNGLFDTDEVRAAVSIFRFLTGDDTEDDLRDAWSDADVGLEDSNIDAGVSLLKGRRTPDLDTNRFPIYNLQRVYLDFLETVSLREERVPSGRGEIVFYNLGKFSQVISDYEAIHFKSEPTEKYRSFVGFLTHQAPDYYPEGGQDVAYAIPDAVRIMTVHQAKGMEFPCVFLPALQRNRFASKKQGNQTWNHIPREAVANADRYDGDIEDERRLFYVAITRAEKYLFASWAPQPDNRLYRRPSDFYNALTVNDAFLTAEPDLPTVEKIEPIPRTPLVNVKLSFSDLKYLLLCGYQFKLRLLYGFNPPIHEALGYGRSLHNALAEIHQRSIAGDVPAPDEADALASQHLNARYAYGHLEKQLLNSAQESLRRYLKEHSDNLDKLEHVEEPIELNLPNGVVVSGRIDLIRRTDTGMTAVVDFKSTDRAQEEDVTRVQLNVYALGYEQMNGAMADLIEIHNMDDGGSHREVVNRSLMTETKAMVSGLGDDVRQNSLKRLPMWEEQKCGSCDLAGICRTKPTTAS